MDIPEKIVEKYLKIKAMSVGGSDGEKLMAHKLMAKMEQEHPGIDFFASMWEQNNSDIDEEETQEPPHWSDVYQQQQANKRDAEWKQRFSQWGQAASQAFSWAANMASQAFGIQEAKNLAMEQGFTTISYRRNGSGTHTLNVRLAEETVEYIHRMNEEQRATYCNTVAQRVAAELYNSI